MKITAVSTIGTYHNWIQYGVASIYNSVDEVIIINGGYDIDHPEDGDDIPLELELKQLKHLDVNKKIMQVKPSIKRLENLLGKEMDWTKCEIGRARNISLAFQLAYHMGADWILKFDSDQIFDENFTREALISLADNEHNGYRFAEYADYFRTWDRCQAMPGKFTDDGSLFFQASKEAWAVGGGSPVHYRDQFEIYDMRTFHMRRIAPPHIYEADYHFERLWYHTYGPNSIGELAENREGKTLTLQEIRDKAVRETNSLLDSEGHDREYFAENFPDKVHMFPPHKPPVVEIGPIDYIKRGLPDGQTIR